MKDRFTFITLLSFFILAFISIIQAQPDTLWTKTFGGNASDGGYSVQQTLDGGYIITGWTESMINSNSDVWLIKTNGSGDTLWTKMFGGNGDDWGNSVQQTTDGGYIITGWTESLGAGNYDVWLIKTNGAGDMLWSKTYGGNSADGGQTVQQTTDGGYILTGFTNSFGAGDSDVWLIKTNASGDTMWSKTYGGIYSDVGASVQQTSDGGYIITGTTESFSPGNKNVYLINTDSTGEMLWVKTFGGNLTDEGSSGQQTIDGGYIITGNTFLLGPIYSAVLLIKTNNLGDTVWTRNIWKNNLNSGKSVRQTQDGGYIIVGETETAFPDNWDIFLVKIDSFGDTLWSKTFGGNASDAGFSVQQTSDGGYIITGVKGSFGASGLDVWLIKTSPDVSNMEDNTEITNIDFSLHQNYPNPFNPITTIKYSIAEMSKVSLTLFNLLGEEVTSLVNEEKSVGNYSVEFNAANLPSGVYFYRLQAGGFISAKKMLLLK